MTHLALDMYRQGKISYEIEPEFYVNILETESEKAYFSEFYSRLKKSLQFLKRQYPADIGDVEIFADTLHAIKAQASKSRIVISRGAIDHLRLIPQNEFLYTPNNELEISGKTLSYLGGFWIVAHEYFHIARGHLELLDSLYGDNAAGFEYDADNMATAALYRYTQAHLGARVDEKAAKSIALFPIFWCVRALIYAGRPRISTDKHPSWEERLFFSIMKLAHVDKPHPNFGRTTATENEEKYLLSVAFYYEQAYVHQVGSVGLPFFDWIQSYLADPPQKMPTFYWSRIQVAVRNSSKLISDQFDFSPRFGYRVNVDQKLKPLR